MNTGNQSPGPSTLSVRAFATSTDPRFLWPGKTYQDALATLQDGILQNAGLLLLTGDPGSGKTLVTNALLDCLGDKVVAAKITYPTLPPADFYRSIGAAYAIAGDLETRASFLPAFSTFLDAAAARDQRVLLIIDDAQSLTPELFEELPHLADPESAGKPRANVLLVGPNDLMTLLERDHAPLAERIRIRCSLSPLSERETEEYVRHRLLLAGSDADLFSPAAIRAVFRSSAGTPGLINILCDLALRSGHAQGARPIGEGIVSECAKALGFQTNAADPPPAPALSAPARFTQEDQDALITALKADPERQRQGPHWRRVAVHAGAAALLIAVGGALGAYLASSGREGRAPLETHRPEGRATSGEAAPPKGIEGKPLSTLTPPRAAPQEKVLQRTEQAPAALPGAKPPTRAATIEPEPGRPPVGPEATRRPVQGKEEADLRLPDSTSGAARAEPTREDPESPDPGAIIDWILTRQSAQNR